MDQNGSNLSPSFFFLRFRDGPHGAERFSAPSLAVDLLGDFILISSIKRLLLTPKPQAILGSIQESRACGFSSRNHTRKWVAHKPKPLLVWAKVKVVAQGVDTGIMTYLKCLYLPQDEHNLFIIFPTWLSWAIGSQFPSSFSCQLVDSPMFYHFTTQFINDIHTYTYI